jgi:hypothetical protein
MSSRCAHRRSREPRLAPLASRKYKFLAAHGHAMQFPRIVQAQQPAIHVPARREFAHHRCQMTAGPLHPANGIQLSKQSNQHAPSLPCVAT